MLIKDILLLIMQYLLIVLLSIVIISGLASAEHIVQQVSNPTTLSNYIFNPSLHPSSLQLSLFSYKPELGDLNNILQRFGLTDNPVAMMPTISWVYQHIPELDSRIEIGYWRTQLETPPPTPLSLSATLVPISYQLIYRPVLLYNYLPIYLGAGMGVLRANFDGTVVDMLVEQGITLNNSESTTTGYVIIGLEFYQWKPQSATRASVGNNATLSFELKRILKTVKTTGTQPLNIILDGTAIGFSIRTQF